MEEQKIDKRSKAYKEEQKLKAGVLDAYKVNTEHSARPDEVRFVETKDCSPIEKLIATALPVSKAEFHAAVNNVDNVPETHFSEKSDNKGRRAEMWLTAGGNLLICKQENAKRETKYVGVPAASVKFVHFK